MLQEAQAFFGQKASMVEQVSSHLRRALRRNEILLDHCGKK